MDPIKHRIDACRQVIELVIAATQRDATSEVVGTFSGLAEGALKSINGVIYRDDEDGDLSYNFTMAILDIDLE